MSTIRLGTKFQLKLIILIFGTKFPQKGYFWSETEKLNIMIKFNIFELAFNHFHGILRLFDVLPNFHFPHAKRCAIITYENDIYELPQEMTNDFKILVN